MKKKIVVGFVILMACGMSPALTDAKEDGMLIAGDYLVDIGKRELRRGNKDMAIHEFSKALLIEPNNQEALHFLNALGLQGGVYQQPIMRRGTPLPPRTRMQIIQDDMARVESDLAQMEYYASQMKQSVRKPFDAFDLPVSMLYVQAGPQKVCTDYLSRIDERADIMTMCDGTKYMVRDQWHDGDTVTKYFGRDMDKYQHAVRPYQGNGHHDHKVYIDRAVHHDGSLSRHDQEPSPPETITPESVVYVPLESEHMIKGLTEEMVALPEARVIKSVSVVEPHHVTPPVSQPTNHFEEEVDVQASLKEEKQSQVYFDEALQTEMVEPIYTASMAEVDQEFDRLSARLIELEKQFDYDNYLEDHQLD